MQNIFNLYSKFYQEKNGTQNMERGIRPGLYALRAVSGRKLQMKKKLFWGPGFFSRTCVKRASVGKTSPARRPPAPARFSNFGPRARIIFKLWPPHPPAPATIFQGPRGRPRGNFLRPPRAPGRARGPIFLKFFPGRKKFSALFFNENLIRKKWIYWKFLNLCFHTAVNCTLNIENTLRLSVLH